MMAVETVRLRRTYELPRRRDVGRRVVVGLHGLDLAVREGSVHGLLGPNGAGKTTLCKILSTVLLPSSGSARVFGLDVAGRTREVRRLVGTVFGGERGLYTRLTARQNLHYWCGLYGLPHRTLLRRTELLLHRVGLAERADERVEGLSRGMKQRLHLARGLASDPRLLLLDEPTIGMDPVSTRQFRTLVGELRAEGRTILLTTHDMGEAEALCDQVSLIVDGKLVVTEQPAALSRRMSGHDLIDCEGASAEVLRAVAALPGVTRIDGLPAGGHRVRLDGPDTARAVLRVLVEAGVPSMATVKPRLEDAYITLVGDRGMAVPR